MDIKEFDNDAETASDADYFAFVEWLSERTVEELKSAKGSGERQNEALRRYFETGEKANVTAGELVDFLCVSAPSLLDRAGYDGAEADDVMSILENFSL